MVECDGFVYNGLAFGFDSERQARQAYKTLQDGYLLRMMQQEPAPCHVSESYTRDGRWVHTDTHHIRLLDEVG